MPGRKCQSGIANKNGEPDALQNSWESASGSIHEPVEASNGEGAKSSDRLLDISTDPSQQDDKTDQFIRESEQRVRFFFATLVSMASMTLVGAVVARRTSSDMVSVDVINMLGDAVSFVINIMVEKIKQKQPQSHGKVEPRKRILFLDIVGGSCSFAILAVIVVWGACSATQRLSDPVGNPVHEHPEIFGYAVLNLIVDVIVLWYFSSLTDTAVGDTNGLNLVSGVMHLGFDAARCFITIVIASFMLWHPQLVVIDALADAIGALLLCIILGWSSVLIAVQAFRSWRAFNSLGNDSLAQSLDSSQPTQELSSGSTTPTLISSANENE